MREGWQIWKSRNFKRRLLRAVLETGTMRGLFNIFRRHYAVLTNFTVNVMKSRRYWPGGAHLRGPAREGHGVDRPGPKGGLDRPRAPLRPSCTDHPLQALAGPSGARSAVCTPLPGSWLGTRYYPSPVPTRYHTPPQYPPCTHPAPHTMYANVTTRTRVSGMP